MVALTIVLVSMSVVLVGYTVVSWVLHKNNRVHPN